MKPYKLKHVPTGLYFQPHKYRGSHISKSGKIYQTKSNGLDFFKTERPVFFDVSCEVNSVIHKLTEGTLEWNKTRSYGNQVQASTKLSDWSIEEI